MYRIFTLLLLVATLVFGAASPAQSYDKDFFGVPDERDQRFEEAARWAGFYGPVRVSQSDDPRAMNGYISDQVCMFMFICTTTPDLYISIQMGGRTTEEEAYVILFHEIAHYYAFRDIGMTRYPSSESDADLMGARLALAYGIPLRAFETLWQTEIAVIGDEIPTDGIHPRNSDRLQHVLAQVPALPMVGGRSEAP